MKIAVIGAGIIGSSLAYHLQRDGASVTQFDINEAPGGEATPASFAWINASMDWSRDYFDLRMRSMALWRAVADEIDDLTPDFCGSIGWDARGGELEAYVAKMRGWGYDIRVAERSEATAKEPNVAGVPEKVAMVGCDGMVEPVAAARAFSNAAQRLGAAFVGGRDVSLSVTGQRVTAVDDRAINMVVLAGGRNLGMYSGLGYTPPIDTPPGLMVYTKPVAPLLKGLVLAEDVHMRQTPNGAIVAGADFGGALVDDHAPDTAASVMDAMRARLPSAELEMDRYIVGYRPTPKDEYPIVGYVPGVENAYATVMHSGITLAPAIGHMVAREILAGERDGLLAPYGPDRFETGGE